MLPDSIPLDLWLQFGEFGFPLLMYDSFFVSRQNLSCQAFYTHLKVFAL